MFPPEDLFDIWQYDTGEYIENLEKYEQPLGNAAWLIKDTSEIITFNRKYVSKDIIPFLENKEYAELTQKAINLVTNKCPEWRPCKVRWTFIKELDEVIKEFNSALSEEKEKPSVPKTESAKQSLAKPKTETGHKGTEGNIKHEIRADLKDISNSVIHLLEIAGMFHEKYLRWGEWWHRTQGTGSNLFQNSEIRHVAERLYGEGRSTAGRLSEILPTINDINICQKLKGYIDVIRTAQKNWINEDSELISDVKDMISKYKGKYDLGDLEIMLRWHEEALETLKSLDTELAQIENSERYKIENALSVTEPPADDDHNRKHEGKEEVPPPIDTDGLWNSKYLKSLREIDSNAKRDGIAGDKNTLKRLKEYLTRRRERGDIAETLTHKDGRIKTSMPHRSMFKQK